MFTCLTYRHPHIFLIIPSTCSDMLLDPNASHMLHIVYLYQTCTDLYSDIYYMSVHHARGILSLWLIVGFLPLKVQWVRIFC